MKKYKHIEIVSSTMPGLSSMSERSRQSLHALLKQHYSNTRITLVNEMSDLEGLVARMPDLVILGMKFIPLDPNLGIHDPNKIWLAQHLDANGITYTGSNQIAHHLELNKPLAKQQIIRAGLKSSPFYVAKQGQALTSDMIHLSYPVFIKPANRGGGSGVDEYSVAHNFKELHAKVTSIAEQLQADSLIEEYLPGREFSVAILKKQQTSEFSVMPIELVAESDERGVSLLGGDTKSANTEIILAITDERLKASVTELAMDAFSALGARDYGRIDIRLDANNVPHFLEANLIPSLISGYGSFPKACVLNENVEYEEMILKIVDLGFARDTSVITEVAVPDSIILPELVQPVLGAI